MVRIIDCDTVDKSSILFICPHFCILMDRILDYGSKDKGSNPFRNIFIKDHFILLGKHTY